MNTDIATGVRQRGVAATHGGRLSVLTWIALCMGISGMLGCGGGGGGGSGSGGGSSADQTTTVTSVVGTTGGSISLSTGVKATFDAGIVADDTAVTVSSTKQPSSVADQEVKALSPVIKIQIPAGAIQATAPADSGITVEFPLTGSMATGLVAGLSVAGVASSAGHIVQVTVEGVGKAVYYAPLTVLSTGAAVVSLARHAIDQAAYSSECILSGTCPQETITISALDAVQCTTQPSQLYQVNFANGIPSFSSNIVRNGKPPLILVHGWQELGIILMTCDKPYSSTWQTFLRDYALDPVIFSKFQVFSFAYSSSNQISYVGGQFAQIVKDRFGQDSVYVVAHSMGGLVTRSALVEHGATNVMGLVTLATPHHGTPIASKEGPEQFWSLSSIVDLAIGGPGAKDLAWDNFDFRQFHYNSNLAPPGNEFLERLNRTDGYRGRYVVFAASASGVPYSYVTWKPLKDLGYDNDMVVPDKSALFYGSATMPDITLRQQQEYVDLTHMNITADAGVLSDTRSALLGLLNNSVAPMTPVFTVLFNGMQATFNAGSSSAPSATIASYQWSFGDGATATGPTAVHTFDSTTGGPWAVTLTITDTLGRTATTTRNIVASCPIGLALQNGQCVPPGQTSSSRIAAGNGYGLVVRADGSLWAWGDNNGGLLGDGTANDRPIPVLIGTGYTAVAVGGGDFDGHSVALTADGGLLGWGVSTSGQVPSNVYVPTLIDTGYVSIATGDDHSMGVKADGSLWAWGDNSLGQLGDGTKNYSSVPKQIGTGYNVVAAGVDYSLALKADGSLWAWGWNAYGQLGDGTTTNYSLVPKQIGIGYIAISAGDAHNLALKADGTLWAWGSNASGQLGDGTNTPSLVPKPIGAGFQAISAGADFSLAVKLDGSLWSWGRNDYGQLGDGTTQLSLVPKQVGTGYVGVSAGREYWPPKSLAMKADGSVWAWGLWERGVGDGVNYQALVPTRVSLP